MEIDWKSDEEEVFEVAISALVENRSGRLAAIANTIASLGVNIEDIAQQENPHSTRLFHIVVVIKNIVQLNDVLEQLNKLPHLISAERI